MASTGAVELRKELSIATSLDLPATLIFDYPSVAEMTAALVAMLPAASQRPAVAKPKQAAAAKVDGTRRGPAHKAAAADGKNLASDWLPLVGNVSACPYTFVNLDRQMVIGQAD